MQSTLSIFCKRALRPPKHQGPPGRELASPPPKHQSSLGKELGGRVPREKERILHLAFKLLFSPSFASFRNKLRLSPISLYFLFPFASHPRSFFLFLSAFLASVFSGFSNPLFRVVEGRRRSCPSPPRSTAVKQTRKPRNRSSKASTARRHRRRRNEGERAR